ncbi:hypothetical protein EON64_17805 [archaeon]|nr:MAG: hypothetical protein EON64_17805 [archaeon]
MFKAWPHQRAEPFLSPHDMTGSSQPLVWLREARGEPQSLLLVGPSGKTARLYCPFIAVCIHPVGTIQKLEPVTVTAVSTTTGRRLVYIIGGKAYYQRNFRILIEL